MSDAAGRPDSEYTEGRLAVTPFGFAGGFAGRHRDVAAMSSALALGFGFLFAGLQVVHASPDWGFTYGGAVAGVLSQLATTGPAAVLIAAAAAANILAGAVALRLLGGPAFRRLSDLALAGFAAAVILDAATLFLLGSLGLFGWPELLALHAAVGAAYLGTRRGRPLMSVPVRFRVSRPAAWWFLVVAVWAGPLILQLASPAVPFSDVLPNHVAPVEHIRVFGSFSTLTTSPSPIYGPSRLMLGYVSLLGQLTTITNLDAILADAAFALPLTILVALAIRRLAGALFGGSASFWVLLTFPLTFTFMRIPDARDTVTVFPLALWALSGIAADLRRHGRPEDGADRGDGTERGAGALSGRSRVPDLGLTCALGASVLVHPIVGLVAITTVTGIMVLYPERLTRRLLPAIGGGLILAIPQFLTMSGIGAPAWVGAIFVVAGIGAAFGLSAAIGVAADRLAARPTALGPMAGLPTMRAGDRSPSLGIDEIGGDPPSADFTRVVLIGVTIVALFVLARRLIPPSGDPTSPSDPAGELMVDFPYLVWLCAGGAALALLRPNRGWILLGCAIAAGLAGWATSGFIGNSGLTEQSVHYEVPKTIEYWLPVMLAIGGAGVLAAFARQRWLWFLRPVAIGALLLVAEYPLTQPLATDVQIGEHRGAESLGLALREAQLGYWYGLYPDSRHIVDGPEQAVVDMLRSEEEAGRLGPQTQVLNIASSFQEWVSVPIGVFTGAMETSVSLDPLLNIHTVGGRLLGFDQLPEQLASGYGYVVLEPAGLWPDLITQTESLITKAGYRAIWSNSQATVYGRG